MKVALVYTPKIKKYDFGPGHPFRGDRYPDFINFFEERFAKFRDLFERIEPEMASDEILEMAHSRDYIRAIGAASKGLTLPNISKYASPDNQNPPSFLPRGIDEGARVCVGTSLLAGELVAEGKFKKAIGIGGGLHHAKKSYGEGFCIYNDVVISGRNLLEKGLERILILDTDAHAGNGTAELFYEDPRVLFIDIHQYSWGFYPGTGRVDEIGAGKGIGYTVNLPLMPGTGDDSYQYLLEEIVFPLAKEFEPQIMIRYGGSDSYYQDSLTNLGLTLDGLLMIGKKVREIAKEVSQEKEVDLLASGYNQKILPYAWSAIISGLLDLEVDLSDLKEPDPPAKKARYEETKDMVRELKKNLKKYWRCM